MIVFHRDITERKRAEAALRKSEAFLNMLMETIPIPVFYKDSEGRYLGFNKAFETFLGKSKEQLIGKSVFDINPPDLAKIYHAKDIELFEKPGVQIYDSRVRDVQGVLHNVIFHKASLTDAQGSVTGLIGAVLDITERKQAEERLQQSEERLRAITDSAQDAILMMDPEGRVSYWNPAAERIFGHTRDEAIGQNLHGLIAPARFLPAHHSTFPVFLLTGKGAAVGKTLDLEARRKDGQEISVQLSLSAVRMNDGWHAVGLVRDITQSKLAEEKLKFTNTLLSTQQEATIDGILVVDEKARILSYNRRFVEMWGLPAKLVEERVDEPVLQFMTAQLADPLSFLLRVQWLYEHRQEASQDELSLADGRVFDRYSAPMFGSDNQYYGRVWYFRDITERKHNENELQRYSAELEKSNNELKEALANVKQLTGMLPICASCKKIRDDKGYWSGVESYISDHSNVLFSHGICPECAKKLYPDMNLYDE